VVAGFRRFFCGSEQIAVSKLKDFLTDEIGWTVAEDVTDTASDRDVVFQSDGEEEVQNNFTRYIRVRGTGDAIRLYTYETFINVSDFTGEVTDATYGLITTGAGTFEMQAVADKERVSFVVETSFNTRLIGYVGRITSYYSVNQHPFPNLVKGGENILYDWLYSANPRNMFMMGVDNTIKHYVPARVYDDATLDASVFSLRRGIGSRIPMSLTIVHDGDAVNSEAAGEPRGLFQVSSLPGGYSEFLKIDNRLYIVFESNGTFWANGPVTASGTAVPSLVPV
jgi:hypothetical protein